MTVKLFNTMSRKIEDFKPIKEQEVGFYSCGPTVYHYAHIGNLRSFIQNDILKRMLIENGYKVRHVMNLTDVGHLTSDDDSGEDKMEKGAARENKSVWEIAKFYTDEFLKDFNDLNLIHPDFMPKATDYIQEQIDLIRKLEELGYTYKIENDGIYYDTSKFPEYGKLTGGTLSGNRAGARVEFNDLKRNSTDFALWKFSPKNEKRQMEWDSPWGIGFPGWHTECCAMSMKLLGNHFDIHTGGEDLSRIHHNNEIAQSEPIVGKPWVRYWIHTSFLVDKSGEKMSKSKGEFLGMDALRQRGYDPMVYKYLVLLSHFQSQLAFSWSALEAASNGYKNLVKKLSLLLDDAQKEEIDNNLYKNWHEKILNTISDNMKTAETLVLVQELLKDSTVNSATKIALFEFIDRLLGLQFLDRAQKIKLIETESVPKEIQELANQRKKAKQDKNWALADEIRNKIDLAGWSIIDTKDGIKLIKRT